MAMDREARKRNVEQARLTKVVAPTEEE